MWNSLLVQVPQKEGGVGKPLSVPQAGSLSPSVTPFTVCMAHPSITYWLWEGSCTPEVKALGRWDVHLAEGKSEATEQWYSEEMAVFKILLETIPLMLVAKYKHPALSPSSGQILMLFPNHPSSCSFWCHWALPPFRASGMMNPPRAPPASAAHIVFLTKVF